ncbi:MAG: type I-F CRISPR-associated protein Csy3 [Moraxellaceae bacterium]|nr:type I-F CRISPR-associated protein Csy3 [Moraxellaceae bacterium]
MSQNTKKTDTKLPSLLAFERKLEVSDALMYAGNWEKLDKRDEWQKITVTQRQNRSTQSAYGIDDAKKSEPNPVAADNDDANLPMNKDTLRVNFTLRVIGNLGKPFACNDRNFQSKIIEKTLEFKGENGHGLETLALRYAHNIANGRFLWRNRVCAEKIEVHVYMGNDDKPLKFNAFEYNMNDFASNQQDSNLITLRDFMLQGLNGGDSDFVFLKVEAYAKLGHGQHVFPSQEMNMSEKKKVLFQLDGCAAIHNVKIGNAIRTIDNWYDENAEFPIAVEPYGSVTQIGYAFRKSKNDLYTLLGDWLNNKEISDNNKNYVVANLIRGGLFQGESDKKKKAEE